MFLTLLRAQAVSGTVVATIAAATISGSATFSQFYTGSASLLPSKATISASATFSQFYTGSASLLPSKATISASGLFFVRAVPPFEVVLMSPSIQVVVSTTETTAVFLSLSTTYEL
jgi:hypothetical protein